MHIKTSQGQVKAPPFCAKLNFEKAAVFAAECSKSGDVMVHCAHGRGRSTCVMVACLVRAGKFHTWEEAFKHAKQYRPCIKLNAIMRSALTEWESTYSDKKQF